MTPTNPPSLTAESTPFRCPKCDSRHFRTIRPQDGLPQLLQCKGHWNGEIRGEKYKGCSWQGTWDEVRGHSLASTLAESGAEVERLRRYEKELEQLSEFVQSRHPVGEVKHIGLLEAVEAAKQVILEHEKQLAAIRAPGGDVESLCETYWEWAHPSTQWRLVGNSQKENIRAGVEYVAARVRAPLLAQIAERDKHLTAMSDDSQKAWEILQQVHQDEGLDLQQTANAVCRAVELNEKQRDRMIAENNMRSSDIHIGGARLTSWARDARARHSYGWQANAGVRGS